jgi:hypothetical protein
MQADKPVDKSMEHKQALLAKVEEILRRNWKTKSSELRIRLLSLIYNEKEMKRGSHPTSRVIVMISLAISGSCH